MIYLDHNATTPIAPPVAAAMQPYLTDRHGNPSSPHALGRAMRAAVDQARGQLATLLGAQPAQIVFTSGGSEANNLALKGAAWSRGRGHLIISAIEHPAIAVPAGWLEGQGFAVTVVGVDSSGRVDPDDVRRAIQPDTILISIMLANNEVGSLQPIADLADIARAAGVLLHTDAAQAVGKVPVRVDELGVDLLSVAGHKFYAPAGIGALYIRTGVELTPLIHGAGHEAGRRAGTEPVAAEVGLGTAAELAGQWLAGDGPAKQRLLRDQLYTHLRGALGEAVVLNGHDELRLPNTLNVSFAGCAGPELLASLPGVCCSAGAACHGDRRTPSSVLTATGMPTDRALAAIRLSLGRDTTEAELAAAADQIIAAVRRGG